jgi:hypothetical protein
LGKNQKIFLFNNQKAKKKIDELLLISNNKDLIYQLGRNFNLGNLCLLYLGLSSSVTPESSLIVLETLEQFVKYKIQPPRHMTKIYSEYMSIITLEAQNKQKELDLKLFQVQDMWLKR